MFKFKRAFSIRDSSSSLKSSSPLSRQESPISKRFCLSGVTPKKLNLTNSSRPTSVEQTPQAIKPVEATLIQNKSPLQLYTFESDNVPILEKANKTKEELLATLKNFRERKDKELDELKSLKRRIVEFDTERLEVDDLLESAASCQVMVRNHLNEMYNGGNELATEAQKLFEECQSNHQKKFDKLAFEISQRLDRYEADMNRNMKELEYTIELNKRIKVTLEYQKQNEIRDKIEAEKVKKDVPEVALSNVESSKDSNLGESRSEETDEDCVIIESDSNKVPVASSQASNNTTVPQDEMTEHSTDGNVICEEDEETDVEEEKQNEEDTFTPCQAQRPN